MEITAFALVKSQSLCFRSYGKLQSQLVAFEGKEVEVEIRKKKRYRSNPQNRFYWGVVIPSIKYAMESKGFIVTKDQIHELLKFKFLKGEIISVATGEVIPTLGSTTNLSTSDFMDYITQIQVYAASELDCIIPEPNESMSLQFNEL